MLAKVLVDNISKNDLEAEWGLSIYIEENGKKILLDTGKSNRFLKNAGTLGIDLSKVDCGVLSHAHYDHSDGMEYFFDVNRDAKFYLRESSAENCYHKLIYPFGRYIGIKKGTLEKYKNRVEYVSGDYMISEGIYLIPHKTEGLEKIGKKGKMYVKRGLLIRPDDFSHEQSLVIDTAKGLFIFNSCSHGGADNIINEVAATFNNKKIYAICGGFHLFMSSEKEVRAFANRVKETGIEHVYTGHCTGNRAFDILKEELGDIVTQIYVGMEIE